MPPRPTATSLSTPHARSRSLYVALICAAWVIAVIAVAVPLLLRSFEAVERDSIRRDVAQVRHALEADLRQLEVSTRDYGEWDVVYDFVRAPSPDVVRSNFTDITLDGMQVDVAIIDDVSGARVWGGMRVPATKTLTAPIPEDFDRQFRRALAGLPRATTPAARFVRVGDLLVAVATIPVLRTDRSGPSVGTLTFARYLESDEIERVRRTSQLPVALVPLWDARGVASLPASVRDRLSTDPEPGTAWAEPRDGRTVDGAVVLADGAGRPIAVLATNSPRTIVETGRRTTWILCAIVAIVGALGAALLGRLTARSSRHMRERLEEERRYRTVVEQLDEGVLLADPASGTVVETNAAIDRLLGVDATAPPLQLRDLLSGADECLASLAASPQGRHAAESNLRTPAGRRIEVEARFAWVRQGDRRLVCCVIRDLTARRHAEDVQRRHRRRLAHLAHHDALTGLPNRLYLASALPKILARAQQRRESIGMLYVDLDQFKQTNDTRGHAFGDLVLRAVAARLRSGVSREDLIVRMGGDEFVVVAGGVQEPGALDALADRLLGLLRMPGEIDGTTVRAAASIGVAKWPDHAITAEDLLKHADIALYEAKARGRDRVATFSPEMTVRVAERNALEHALRNALDEDQLFVEYQPIVDLKTRQLVRFEALARWRHPMLGLVPPARFVGLAEESGLIVALGERVLELVCRQLAEWRDLGVRLVPVAVNVSARQLDHEPLSRSVLRMTQRYAVDPSLLAFELTETTLLDSPQKHAATLERLRAMGCLLSIDDFGTGYSSLSYLKHLSVDSVKIDRAFVRDMVEDSSDAQIVRAVVAMAKGLGVRTVAEGVETADQQRQLQALGCDYGQGYLFGKPLPARHCRALLDEMTQQLRISESRLVRAMKPK
jgi:diguanylate cyclase (GGDEF)-like protein/PAS domain S-box-containing protein